MPDYQKGKIYKLWSPQGEEDEIYYGSTIDELRKRKNQHKLKKNSCSSKILFEKYDDVRIELLEDYPCNNRAELEKKEGEYIRANKCLNRNVAGRTRKEWYEDNKENTLKLVKEYYENNKQSILEHHKEYQEQNKEKITERKKKYNQNNKQSILEYNKKYNENNKDKVTCDCGCIFRKNGLIRHQKTSKHIKLMEEINKNI